MKDSGLLAGGVVKSADDKLMKGSGNGSSEEGIADSGGERITRGETRKRSKRANGTDVWCV